MFKKIAALIIICFLCAPVVRAEVISIKGYPTDEKCQAAGLSLKGCVLMRLEYIKNGEPKQISKETKVSQSRPEYIDLERCTEIGNQDPVCQGRIDPTAGVYPERKVFVPDHTIHRVRTSTYAGVQYVFTDNKPASVLVRNPVYIGQGNYCYALDAGWICEE